MTEEPEKVTESTADKLINIRKQKEALERLERTTGNSGAVPLGPKALLLHSDLPAKHPDKHYRWVNTSKPEKAQARIMEGYTKVPDGEGGRSLGGTSALFEIPRAKYEARVAAQDKLSRQRLDAHKDQAQRMAESLSRELRDNHGIKVDPRRLLQIEED